MRASDQEDLEKCSKLIEHLYSVLAQVHNTYEEVCGSLPIRIINVYIIFIAAATNHVNTNVLMMWQKHKLLL